MWSAVRSAPEYLDEIYAFGCSHLGLVDLEQRRLHQAEEVIDSRISLSVDRDVPLARSYQHIHRARLKQMVGEWDDAIVDARAVLDIPGVPLARSWAHLVQSLIALRREGTTEVEGIDEAWRVLRHCGDTLAVFPATVIAERSWLTETSDDRLAECRAILDRGHVEGLEYARGELAMWLHRADPAIDAVDVAQPYRFFLDGEFEAAADEFQRLSLPYEAALALTDTGEPARTRRGLDMLDRLGAAAVAAKVRRDLRARGVTVVPARRRPTTLANACGLTMRQLDVLRLMGQGLTNAELAERMFLSVRTVDKHVAAILDKLQAANRRDAVRRARALGILDSAG